MKRRNYLITVALCAAILVACDQSEVFYATSYPIVRIEAAVTAQPIVIPPTTEGGESTQEPNPIIEVVSADVLANAPVRAEGRYTLDFTRYDGGLLRVDTATDEGRAKGVFIKAPGSDSLRFVFGAQDYVGVRDLYQAESGGDKVVLLVDLTDHYKALYPDDKITQVFRKEFTSANFK